MPEARRIPSIIAKMAADILRKQNLRHHCFANLSTQHSDSHAGLSSAEHVFRILLKGRARCEPATNIEAEARFCVRIKGIGIPMRWMQADSRIEQLQALEVIHATRLAGFASDRRGKF